MNDGAGTFGPPFSSEERELAVRLHSQGLSLNDVARRLARSPTSVYKVLRGESCPTRTNKKVDAHLKEEILRLYYRRGLSSPAIAGQLGVAKPTVLYWPEKIKSPIPAIIREAAGLCTVKVASGKLDLLPFAKPGHLRWADDALIVMRTANSRCAMNSRRTNAVAFFRLAGFYLAEGDKISSHASMSNTNGSLVADYHQWVLFFVHSGVQIRNIPETDQRAAKQLLDIGGICIKTLLLNAIGSIMSFLDARTTSSEA
jgi:transposase-like protein